MSGKKERHLDYGLVKNRGIPTLDEAMMRTQELMLNPHGARLESVLRFHSEGLNAKQIALKYDVTPGTVKVHYFQEIIKAFEVKSMNQALWMYLFANQAINEKGYKKAFESGITSGEKRILDTLLSQYQNNTERIFRPVADEFFIKEESISFQIWRIRNKLKFQKRQDSYVRTVQLLIEEYRSWEPKPLQMLGPDVGTGVR